VNGIDALPLSLDGGCNVVDACALYQLSVVSSMTVTSLVGTSTVPTKLVTVNEYSKFFCVGDVFLWKLDPALTLGQAAQVRSRHLN